MAESEGKSGSPEEPATISKDTAKSDETSVLTEESKSSSMKSSWSGWFQKVNDAVMAMTKDDDDEEKKDKEQEKGEESAEITETQDKGPSWGAWGSSLLQQAKEKTLTTFELVKKDLTEFSDVVQNETAHIVSATATTIRDRAPQLVGSIVGTVNTVLLVDDTTQGEEENEIPITAAMTNRSQARLYAIQSDPETYCSEPDGAPELFDDWLDHHFNLEDKKEDISRLLVTNPAVRNLFAQLVPSQVSNTTFWQRYFYRIHQFELDEARRSALLQREGAEALADSSDIHRLSWGDESDLEDHGEHIDRAETDSFCDLAKEDQSMEPSGPSAHQNTSPSSTRQQSPLCGREPPEGVGAVPKTIDGQRRDSFNVEMKAAEDQEKLKATLQPMETDVYSVSSFGTPPRNDGDSGSPTDKKSDDWVEWESNEHSS